MSLLRELQRRNVLRVAAAYVAVAWLIVQVVETLFPLFGVSDQAARTVVILLAAGFVPVLILAWVFELTPEGLKRDSDVDHRAPASRASAKRLDRIVLVVLALALGYFMLDKFALDPARDRAAREQITEQARRDAVSARYGGNSIAVLAFDDLSPGSDFGYFGDGIAEEILTLLTHVPDVRVAGRTSAFSFKNSDATIREIGETLDVAHVLEGSVRTDGKRIRITALLLDAGTDTQLWSQTYDREFDEIFAIQDEIAQAIVERLESSLLGEVPRAERHDPEAYALYLQARTIFNGEFSEEEFARIGDLLEKALAIDPEYADAIGLYARYLWLSPPESLDEETTIARVQGLVARALAIDPDNGRMLGWRGFLTMVVDNDMYEAARYIERSLAADPHHFDSLWGALNYLPLFGRADLAVTMGDYLAERDPLCLNCYKLTADALTVLGRYDDAVERLERGLALDPAWVPGRITLACNRVLQGAYEAALEITQQLREELGGIFTCHLEALHALGRHEELEALLPEFIEIHAAFAPLINASLYAWIGETEKAFEWLDKRNRRATWGIRSHLVRPWYQSLHDDPRWQALLDEYQMSEEHWRAIDLDIDLPQMAD